MKLGIFTDSHYSTAKVTCGNRYNSESLRKIQEALEYFQTEKCELVICLGDLIDKESDHSQEIKNLQEVADVFRKCPLKKIVVMGNHDGFTFTVDEFYSILGEDCRPHTISIEDHHLVFLDACHFKTGVHYQPSDEDWTDTYFPMVEQLQQELSTLTGNIHLFLHQNIDPAVCPYHRLYNADQLNALVGKNTQIRTVYQGHYHPGKESEYNGITYITFPAMCENEKVYFIIEK